MPSSIPTHPISSLISLNSSPFSDQEAEERQEALDAEKAQKEQLRLQEVGRISSSLSSSFSHYVFLSFFLTLSLSYSFLLLCAHAMPIITLSCSVLLR